MSSRRGSIHRSVVARSPRLSLLLPALILGLLALLAARTGLALAREAAAPARGEGASDPAEGASSGDQTTGDGQTCLPVGGARRVDLVLDRDAPGVMKRPPCPPGHGSALLSPESEGLLHGHPAVFARVSLQCANGPSPSAPCSQRAPPVPSI